MMKMYFHFGYEEMILFKFWKTLSVPGLLLAIAIIGSIAFLTEASTHINRYLVRRERKKNLCYDIEITPIVAESPPCNGESQNSVEMPQTVPESPTYESVKSTTECAGAEYQPCSSQCQASTSKDLPSALYCQPGTSRCPASPSKCHEKCFRAKLPRYGLTHFGTTLVYGYQTTLNILLMLSFMTYNVWLCLAVVIGRVLGYAFLRRI